MLDYVNYDYMQAVLKKKYAEKIKECYRAFGWELIKREEDSRYDDVYNVFFGRPHKIEHKDELHYMQVELEARFDEISKANKRFCPRSFSCILLTCILSLGLVAGGICLLFLLNGTAVFIGGIILTCAGVATGVLGAAVSVGTRKKEIAASKRISKAMYDEIERLCVKAAEFTGAGL